MNVLAGLTGIVSAALFAAPSGETSVRCADGVVSVGDPKLDVLGKCGLPTLREVRRDDATGSVRSEAWTYDFGPQRFVVRLMLERGRVLAIERGGYGYGAGEREPFASSAARCEPSALHVGDLKLDLLARCGEPALEDAWQERRPSGDGVSEVASDVERWTYDFGPNRFVLIAVLVDGKVVAVERGGYGYAR